MGSVLNWLRRDFIAFFCSSSSSSPLLVFPILLHLGDDIVVAVVVV